MAIFHYCVEIKFKTKTHVEHSEVTHVERTSSNLEFPAVRNMDDAESLRLQVIKDAEVAPNTDLHRVTCVTIISLTRLYP